MNLKSVVIEHEDCMWTDGSLAATLEAHNLWNNYARINQNNTYYDYVEISEPVLSQAQQQNREDKREGVVADEEK